MAHRAARRCSTPQHPCPEKPTLISAAMTKGAALAGLFREAEEVQAAVRQAVKPHTWEAFWLVGVAFWTVDATASHLQISPASVIKAKGRVTKMLQREARRRGLDNVNLTRAEHPKD